MCIEVKSLLSQEREEWKGFWFRWGMRNIWQVIAQQAMALGFSIFQASSGLIGMLKHRGRTPDFFGGVYLHFLSPEDFSGQLMRCWNDIVEVSEGCRLISFTFLRCNLSRAGGRFMRLKIYKMM
jgi:hypothetical protein